jgi:hypothetical protein
MIVEIYNPSEPGEFIEMVGPKTYLHVYFPGAEEDLYVEMCDMLDLWVEFFEPPEPDEEGWWEGGRLAASGHKRDIWSFLCLRSQNLTFIWWLLGARATALETG